MALLDRVGFAPTFAPKWNNISCPKCTQNNIEYKDLIVERSKKRHSYPCFSCDLPLTIDGKDYEKEVVEIEKARQEASAKMAELDEPGLPPKLVLPAATKYALNLVPAESAGTISSPPPIGSTSTQTAKETINDKESLIPFSPVELKIDNKKEIPSSRYVPHLMAFLTDTCLIPKGKSVNPDNYYERSSVLYEAYKQWCDKTNHTATNLTAFGRAMKQILKGIKIKGHVVYLYIKLKEEAKKTPSISA